MYNEIVDKEEGIMVEKLLKMSLQEIREENEKMIGDALNYKLWDDHFFKREG